MTAEPEKERQTFTDFLRKVFKGVLEGIAKFFIWLGIKPNMITAAGLIGNIAASVLIATGQMFWGGIIAMLVGPLDALDGTIARLLSESSSYGAFIDSVTDRYSEIALFGGLLIFFIETGTWQDALLVFLAVVGSVMVSYVRARAESLDYSAKVGLITRAERYLILIPGIIIGYPRISLWILAILANFTAIQRIWHVRKQAKQT